MKNTLLSVWNFYLEGFRSMTLGRTLWIIILLKLFIMFVKSIALPAFHFLLFPSLLISRFSPALLLLLPLFLFRFNLF